MKAATLTTFVLWAISCLGQGETKISSENEKNERDTTTMLFGKTKVLVIRQEGAEEKVEVNGPETEVLTPEELRAERIQDSLDAIQNAIQAAKDAKRSEPHWAGMDFGATIITNGKFQSTFPNEKFWQNDPARSFHFNLNLVEKKLNFGTPYAGLTTGLGISFTQIAFQKNYLITDLDTLVTATIDTTKNYSKNKLRAAYLTVPLMLEFNTNRDNDKSWYLAAGVVGGVKLTSQTKRKWDDNGNKRTEKRKGGYGLETFKLDAIVRVGYGDLGMFASYALIPMFDGAKTAKIHPFNFGITLNF